MIQMKWKQIYEHGYNLLNPNVGLESWEASISLRWSLDIRSPMEEKKTTAESIRLSLAIGSSACFRSHFFLLSKRLRCFECLTGLVTHHYTECDFFLVVLKNVAIDFYYILFQTTFFI